MTTTVCDSPDGCPIADGNMLLVPLDIRAVIYHAVRLPLTSIVTPLNKGDNALYHAVSDA